MKTVVFSLSRDDIQHGAKEDPNNCPWALCVRRTLNRTDLLISVEYFEIQILQLLPGEGRADPNGEMHIISLPEEVSEWINEYDNNDWAGAPISFEAEVPEWALPLEEEV